MDSWLFHVNTDYSVKSLVAAVVPWHVEHLACNPHRKHSGEPTAVSNVVFLGEKRRGGLRIVDARLTCDLVLAPVPPPHIHSDQAPSFSSSAMPRVQSSNIATAMALCKQTTRELWVGWSSGHISVLSTAAAPSCGMPSSSSASEVPRYADWDDVLYAHRGAVHHVVATHADRYVVSCSYDMNVVVWEASTRRQLRSLTALARNAQLAPSGAFPHTTPSHRHDGVHQLRGQPSSSGNVNSSSGPLLSGVCRFVCEFPLLVMHASGVLDNAAKASVLWVAFDGGAQVVVHGMESLQRYDASNGSSIDAVEGLTVAHVGTMGDRKWSPTAASAASHDEVASVVCYGDDRGHVRFVSCAAVFSTKHPQKDTPARSIADIAADLLATAFEDDASTTLNLGHKCGKVVEIVSCGVVACPSHGEGDADCDATTTTFAFLATCSNRAIALVNCTVTSVACGSLMTRCSVASVQTAAAPIVALRVCASGASPVGDRHGAAHREVAQPIQMHYATGSDGSVSTVVTFSFGALATDARMVGPPAATSLVASWGYGDMARERNRLKHAVELVQRAKNSVLTADTMVLDRLQQEATLTEAQRDLRQQVEALQAALTSETARAQTAEEQLSASEEAGEALRARLRDATTERERLSRLLDIAARDQQCTTTSRDAAQEEAALNAIKVDECIVQLEQRKEECNHMERGWRAADTTIAHLKERNEILAAKVVELERLLASAEEAVRVRADKTHNHVKLLDEQQEVIRELKSRHQQAMRQGEHYRIEAEQLRLDVQALQQQLAIAQVQKVSTAPWSGQPSSGDHGTAFLPPRSTVSTLPRIAADEEYRRSASSGMRSLPSLSERIAGVSHSLAARDDSPQQQTSGGEDDGLVVQRGPRSTMSSQPLPSSSVRVISLNQSGRTSSVASSVDLREEYLKSLAPPVRTDATTQRHAVPASISNAPTDLGTLEQPGSVVYAAPGPQTADSEATPRHNPPSASASEPRGAVSPLSTPSSSSTSTSVPWRGEAPRSAGGGGVRSVTVSLQPIH